MALQAGSQVPADCVLDDGDVVIEAAVLTGEARPVHVAPVMNYRPGLGY